MKIIKIKSDDYRKFSKGKISGFSFGKQLYFPNLYLIW